ncbi:MAG: acyltransferase [Gammaproteobacteria bacterium]|nr:acyltransferase [Gammaproteobacteria bacterium]
MTDSKNNAGSLHDQLTDSSKSAIQRYQDLALGTSSTWYLIKFELIMLFTSWVPGALGLVLRKLLYPRILGSVGRNVVFGQGVSIRHGLKINIADNVVIDDQVLLDAKGENNNGITLGEDTIVSRAVVLSCKNGDIRIGSKCSVGIGTIVHSTPDCNVEIGDEVLIGAYCYFVGGGGYISSDLQKSFKSQGPDPRGGIVVKDNVWFGANIQILDGVTVGGSSIIGASSVLNRDVADFDIVAGVPAKVLRSRKS